MKVRYFGQAGHFIAAHNCAWHLHAHVGRYCVSGVGEYRPGDAREREMGAVGVNRLYEVMVFDTRRKNSRWSELRMAPANTRDGAVKAFERLLAWASKETEKKGRR